MRNNLKRAKIVRRQLVTMNYTMLTMWLMFNVNSILNIISNISTVDICIFLHRLLCLLKVEFVKSFIMISQHCSNKFHLCFSVQVSQLCWWRFPFLKVSFLWWNEMNCYTQILPMIAIETIGLVVRKQSIVQRSPNKGWHVCSSVWRWYYVLKHNIVSWSWKNSLRIIKEEWVMITIDWFWTSMEFDCILDETFCYCPRGAWMLERRKMSIFSQTINHDKDDIIPFWSLQPSNKFHGNVLPNQPW